MQQFMTEHGVDILPTQNVNSPRLKDSECPDGRLGILVGDTIYNCYSSDKITCRRLDHLWKD